MTFRSNAYLSSDGIHYIVQGIGEFKRVTHFISDIVNSSVLIDWGARKERELCASVVGQVMEGFVSTGEFPTKYGFVDAYTRELGKTRSHQRISREARDLGTSAHKMIELFLLPLVAGDNYQPAGPTLDEMKERAPKGALLAFDAFRLWYADQDIEPLAVEEIVYCNDNSNHKMWYAGTVDLICKLNGEITIIDWKTSANIYFSAAIQIGSYAHAHNFLKHYEPCTKALIVRLPKRSGSKLEVRSFEEGELKAYMSCFRKVQYLSNMKNIFGE